MADLDSFVIARAASEVADDFALPFLENEVFFAVDPDFAAGRSGSVQLTSSHELRFNFAEIEGKRLVLFYTTKRDPRLASPVAGISFGRALRLVLSMRAADGLLLQSSESAWIGVSTDAIESMRCRLEKVG